MAYVYLLDLCRHIEGRLADAEKNRAAAAGDLLERRFQEGRIDAFLELKDFLEKNFVPKLPRRIKERYERK